MSTYKTDDFEKFIGISLNLCRLELGKSLEEVAEKSGIGVPSLEKYEKAQIGIHVRALNGFAAALGAGPADFLPPSLQETTWVGEQSAKSRTEFVEFYEIWTALPDDYKQLKLEEARIVAAKYKISRGSR